MNANANTDNTDNTTYIIVRNSNGDPVRRRIQDAHPTELQNALNKYTTGRLHTVIAELCQNINYLEHALDPR